MTDVWVTKYALSDGIKKCVLNDDHGTCIVVSWPGGFNRTALFSADEWWPSRKQAIEDADRRRTKKIASLKTQIAKLEAMTFEDTPE